MTMNYFPPKDRSDVVNLLQVARWRFSQIEGHADGQAEPKLIKVWSADGLYAVQRVLDWLEARDLASGERQPALKAEDGGG